jgi:hypothetical protein
MVHALEIIHRLLEPGGCLIDLHPKGIPAEFGIRNGNASRVVGVIQETDDFIEYRQADEAIETVLARGLFRLERKGSYDFVMHADRAAELLKYIADEWKDAIVAPEIVDALHAQTDEVTLRDFIHINLLVK